MFSRKNMSYIARRIVHDSKPHLKNFMSFVVGSQE